MSETLRATVTSRINVVPTDDPRHRLLTCAQLEAIRLLALHAAGSRR